MKNLKDYFSSPKSSDVSLNETLESKPCSPVADVKSTTKRKSRNSLSNKNPKKKRLSLDRTDGSPVNTSTSSLVSLDASLEESFSLPSPPRKRKSGAKSDVGKSLSLKKRKPGRKPGRPVKTREDSNPPSSSLGLGSDTDKSVRLDDIPVLDGDEEPCTVVRPDTDSRAENSAEPVCSPSVKEVQVPTERPKETHKPLVKPFVVNDCETCESDLLNGTSVVLSDDTNASRTEPTVTENGESEASGDIAARDATERPKRKRNRNRKSDETTQRRSNDGSDCDPPATPETRQSLLNYFNKVDKPTVRRGEEMTTIKVEAVVHEPRSNEKKETKLVIKPKVKKTRKQPDFDLITSEEDCSFGEEFPPALPVLTPDKPPWKMRISFQSPAPSDWKATGELKEAEELVSDKAQNSRDDSDVIVLDDDTSVEGDVEANPAITPRLRGASTLSAYFGLKTDAKKELDAGGKRKRAEERSAAAQLFLQSPAPSSVARLLRQCDSEVTEGRAATFPVHNHVKQRDRLNIVWNLSSCRLPLRPTKEETDLLVPVHLSSQTETSLLAPRGSCTYRPPPASTKAEINKATKLLKEESGVAVKQWLECLRAMKRSSSSSELWNERYRPKTTDEVLVEKKNVKVLSDWLSGFQFNMANGRSDTESSSGDEFVKEEKRDRLSNTALLVGPPGVGKTAAVFAAAKQNGYQVLELNASCNRNGKKVHLEFSEATQSHKVETKSLFKSKSKKKERRHKQNNKTSLLLIEDSDLIFEDLDDGYVSCLSLLQSSSKRPLVLVANNPNSKHLSKLVSSKSTVSLTFRPPSPPTLGCYLQALSLVEGLVVTREACSLLLEMSDCDPRRAVANLQFYGPLLNQLDQRKLCLPNQSLTSYGELSDATQQQVIAVIRNAKALCVVDMLTFQKDSGRYSEMRESTAVQLKDDDDRCQTHGMRNDIVHLLLSSLAVTHRPLTNDRESVRSNDRCTESMEINVLLSRRAVACDYLGSLRQVARAERTRLVNQTKRNKRYFNHLNNFGVDTSDQSLLDALCSTLNDIDAGLSESTLINVN